MIKFYALCSHNLHCVKRHQKTIPKQDLVIVINSTDQVFRQRAENYCEAEGIEHYITESDGTAATGKNSVLDLIVQHDVDYAVMVDGDDTITPHGVFMYKTIADLPEAPDAVAIQFQACLITDFHNNPHLIGRKTKYTAQYNYSEADPDSIPFAITRNYYMDNLTLRRAMSGFGLSGATPKYLLEATKRQVTFTSQYISKNEVHLRLPFVSKKVAQTFRFDKSLLVGEDTDFYLQIKANHFTTGDVVLKHLFDFYPSYIYDFRVAGLCSQVIVDDVLNCTSWTDVLVERFQWYQDQGLAFTEMPDLFCVVDHDYRDINSIEREIRKDYDIRLPESYVPDCMDLINYPAEKSDHFDCTRFDKCVIDTYNRYKK